MKNKLVSDGYIIVNNCITEKQIKKLKLLSELYYDRTSKRYSFTGNLIDGLYRTGNISYDFLVPEILDNVEINNLIKEVLGSFVLKEILFFFSTPNNDIQELHSDEINYFPKEDFTLPATTIAVQIPLVDFNFKTGGTRIVPKTHKAKEKPTTIENENIEELKNYTPELKVGDCLIRDVRTWHGAGINKTKEVRGMLVIVYTKKWLSSPAKVTKDVFFSLDRKNRHVVNSEK